MFAGAGKEWRDGGTGGADLLFTLVEGGMLDDSLGTEQDGVDLMRGLVLSQGAGR